MVKAANTSRYTFDTRLIGPGGRATLAIWAGATNVLNHPNWGLMSPTAALAGSNVATLSMQSTTFGQATGPATALVRCSSAAT